MLIKEDILRDVIFKPQIIYPGVNFLRADCGPLVEKLKTQVPEEEWKHFSDWRRIIKDPKKAMGWITMWLQASRQGRHNIYSVNYKSQIQHILDGFKSKPIEMTYKGITVEMMFFGNGCTNNSLEEIARIGRGTLPNIRFVTINGDSEVDGKTFKGENAERLVWKAIEEAASLKQDVILLGVNMPSRSFSIWPIQILHLCLDGGAEWSVAQKLARALTRAPSYKESFIIDWCFDPNRSSTIDEILLSTAVDIRTREKIPLEQAMKKVLTTFNIFEMGEAEPYQWSTADYLRKVFDSNTVGRVIGETIVRDKFNLIPTDIKDELLSKGPKKKKKMDTVYSGDDKDNNEENDNKKGNNNKKENYDDQLDEKKIIKEILSEIINQLPRLVHGCLATNLDDAFKKLKEREDFTKAAENHIMPIKIDSIKRLYNEGIINSDRIDLEVLKDA